MARRAALKHWLAAGLLALLAGCTTPPPAAIDKTAMPGNAPASPPSSTSPSESLASDTPAPPVAKPVSGLTDFIARRFRRSIEAQEAPPVETPKAKPEPDTSVDEKYRLTGEQARELERGSASWYGPKFHGRLTANGETYDKTALTAAHKTLPFGTIVRVRNLELGTEVDVRINDRGPFTPGRVIDVSQAAAEALGLKSAGVGAVSLKVTETALRNFKVLKKSGKRRGTDHRPAHRTTRKRR
ncbi:MAG: septal ring lytic transglycosylase RlpA family protein [Polaromonas sp.]